MSVSQFSFFSSASSVSFRSVYPELCLTCREQPCAEGCASLATRHLQIVGTSAATPHSEEMRELCLTCREQPCAKGCASLATRHLQIVGTSAATPHSEEMREL